MFGIVITGGEYCLGGGGIESRQNTLRVDLVKNRACSSRREGPQKIHRESASVKSAVMTKHEIG